MAPIAMWPIAQWAHLPAENEIVAAEERVLSAVVSFILIDFSDSPLTAWSLVVLTYGRIEYWLAVCRPDVLGRKAHCRCSLAKQMYAQKRTT